MNMKDYTFKKFGGEIIEDIGQYLRNYLAEYPNSSIYVGTDSDPKFTKGIVQYATIVALYDEDRRDGVHYVFAKQRIKDKIRKDDVFTRMWQEVERSIEVAEFLETELEGHIKRYTPDELMRLKLIEKSKSPENRNPLFADVKSHQIKLVNIDVDINPDDGKGHNKSNIAYGAAKGYVIGMGYRVRFKPHCWAAKCAADLICNKW